jgi:hypothetical protein
MHRREALLFEQREEVVNFRPPEACVVIRRAGVRLALDGLDDEHTAGFEQADDLPDELGRVKGMIEGVGEHHIHGRGGKRGVVEIAGRTSGLSGPGLRSSPTAKQPRSRNAFTSVPWRAARQRTLAPGRMKGCPRRRSRSCPR